MFEIEIKFRISNVDAYRAKLQDRFGIDFGKPHEEVDLFFQHMSRDFSDTDECLRLRKLPSGVVATYKGPKLDLQTKTREEIELPLVVTDHSPGQTFEACRTFFERLGFTAFAQVVKKRSAARLDFAGMACEVTLDELPTLGFFSEWETSAKDRVEMEEKRERLLKLSRELQLGDSVRTSYLELFLAADRLGNLGKT